MADKRRKALGMMLKRDLLIEAGYKCANPTCRIILSVSILEDHHIIAVSQDGGDTFANLIALCPYCHTLYHKGEIAPQAIRHWKGMLIALNNAFDRESMDLLLYLWHTKDKEIWYSGDGLLHFAGLIAAGLVSFQTEMTYARTQFQNVDMHGMKNVLVNPIPHSPQVVVKKIELSDRGIQLVEAWRNGDETKYRELLSKDHMQL
jgi:hypothetical protein